MNKNLLIITQKVDERDDLLGFFVDWIRVFSKNFDRILVITLAKDSYQLPENVSVYSLGKERNTSKLFRLVVFYKLLFTLAPKSSGIFAHMSPVFVIASWPIAFIFRKKTIFWYLHRSVTARLKIAEKLSYKIVTADKESLKFESKKIVETGHGINVDKFRTDRTWTSSDKLKILSVGRISKIKNYETLIEAAKILKHQGVDFEVRIIGKPVMPKDNEYLKSLQLLIDNYQLQNVVHCVGFIPYSEISQYYKDSDIVIGLTPDGGVDKAVLEGMASGCIVLTSNKVCGKYFGEYESDLIFEYNNPEDLAKKVQSISGLPTTAKKPISDALSASVSKYHGLDNLISQISQLF